MNSGIYKLTFSSGNYYIGQSVNIANRWRAHLDSFGCGKASAKMQQEYNQHGIPDKEVLIYCHRDYLDVMEAYYIHKFDSSRLLNTSIPEKPFDATDVIEQDEYFDTFVKRSLLENVTDYRIYVEENKALFEEFKELTKTIREIDLEVEKDIRVIECRREIEKLKIEAAKPFWKKWFK